MKAIKNLLLFLLIIIMVIALISFGLVYRSVGKNQINYQDLIDKYSEEYDMDKILIASIINVESHYKKDAVSNMGAKGLMQLLPETAKWVTEQLDMDFVEDKLFEPEYNIQLGSFYIKHLINYFKNVDLAIIAYNGGIGNVEKWLQDETITGSRDTFGEIPIRETREYIEKVDETYNLYKIIYGTKLTTENSKLKSAWNVYKYLIQSGIDNF